MTAEGNTYASGGAKSSVGNSDEDLIARIREALSSALGWDEIDEAPIEAAQQALDTLARRLEELKDGLERIANLERMSSNAAPIVARSLLHPEPQEEKT